MAFRMGRWIYVVAWAMAACACIPFHSQPRSPDVQHTDIGVRAVGSLERGEEAAAELSAWYARRDVSCGSATQPAFLCSGVMLRATDSKSTFLPWDPSPDGVAKGGISAAWLRVDTNFPDTFLPNGFIFYVPSSKPSGTREIEVLCAFPFDGDTWNRRTLQGCGPHSADPAQSRPCQELAIHTVQQWLAHYYTPGHTRHSHQCGWDVRIGSPATADRFQQNIAARAGLQSDQWRFNTELVLRTWPSGVGASMPIHSFFYRTGNAQALANARFDQTRYYDNYRKALPIIRLTLPTSPAGTVGFGYVAADQAIPVTDDPIPQLSSVKDPRGLEIPHGSTTYATAVTLRGIAKANQKAEVWHNSVLKGIATANGSGEWTFAMNGLVSGLNNLQIRGLYGSQPTSTIRTLTIPAPAITSVKDPLGVNIPDGGTTYAATVMLSGRAMADQKVEVWHSSGLKGSVAADNTGEWFFTVNGLVPGLNNLQVRGLYGTQPTSPLRRITMPPPTIASVKDPQGVEIPQSGTTNARTVTLSGMAQPGKSVQVWHNSQLKGTAVVGANSAWTFQVRDLTAMAHHFQIVGLYDANPTSAIRILTVR
ncbi:hypothetical protein [Luteibacter jiangsuensis]